MQGLGPIMVSMMPGIRRGCTERGSNQADTQIFYWQEWGTEGWALGPLTVQLVHWRCFLSPVASSRQAALVGWKRARCAGPQMHHLEERIGRTRGDHHLYANIHPGKVSLHHSPDLPDIQLPGISLPPLQGQPDPGHFFPHPRDPSCSLLIPSLPSSD